MTVRRVRMVEHISGFRCSCFAKLIIRPSLDILYADGDFAAMHYVSSDVRENATPWRELIMEGPQERKTPCSVLLSADYFSARYYQREFSWQKDDGQKDSWQKNGRQKDVNCEHRLIYSRS